MQRLTAPTSEDVGTRYKREAIEDLTRLLDRMGAQENKTCLVGIYKQIPYYFITHIWQGKFKYYKKYFDPTRLV